MAKFLVGFVAVVSADSDDGMKGKGFRKTAFGATDINIPTATITDDMRANTPAKLDWTTKGATTKVKDQGYCGSCWAYSTVEGVESGLFMETGEIVELSPQQIIDCDKVDGGCDGGDVDTGITYVDQAGGLATVKTYPETSNDSGDDGKCKKKITKVVQATDYKWAIPECLNNKCDNQNEEDLKTALAEFGPLSICLTASWSNYKGGVYTGKCSHAYGDADHCVQLVGYDTTAQTPYWKVRNSWAASWGEAGHIRLPMGENACGLANWPLAVKAKMIDQEITV